MRRDRNTERTIENLSRLKLILQRMVTKTNYEGKGEEDAREIGVDFNIALNALGKQVPRKLVRGKGKFDGYVCPMCKSMCVSWANYCVNCGQKLEKME